MKKLTILALILGTVGFGYIYVSNHFFSSTPIEAVEKVRYEMKGHLLYEAETDRGKILFILRDLQNGQTINAEYVRKTPLLGWKWGYGGGHTLPSIHDKDPDSYWTVQYFPSPFLFGVILNSQIDSIQVYSYATKESFTASIKATGDRNVRFWYQLLPEEQGTKFKLTAEADHQTISTKISE
ncbi:hypothetical protein MKZ15_09290 [Paenibacillus sp. FSL R7-0216]|uniref:hypothetical protein n=1 Tax=Paenibacillus sp. FSL R7-0216 TaxID=2921677 RepID=UPI0030D701CD